MTAPVFSGLYAQRHMHEYGTTREQMAEVAVKNHENGTKCEYSHFDFTLTVDDVLNAPHVTYSFGLYDCSPQTDGAACLIVASEKLTTRYTDHTRCGCRPRQRLSPLLDGEARRLPRGKGDGQRGRPCLRAGGHRPRDVDVVEQHDCFTFTEILNMEDLGFCEMCEGSEFVASGASRLNGELPVNPSGRLKAKGNPISATGVSQLCELTWQLRGEAGERQIDNPEIGL